MFGNLFTGWHLLIILGVIILLFGAPKLPGLAKSIGQSMRIFKGEVKSMKEDDENRAGSGNASDSAAPTSSTTSSSPAEPQATSVHTQEAASGEARPKQ